MFAPIKRLLDRYVSRRKKGRLRRHYHRTVEKLASAIRAGRSEDANRLAQEAGAILREMGTC